MQFRVLGCALFACIATSICTVSPAETPSPFNELMKQHNLSKMGFYLVLPGETDVHNDVRTLRAAKNQIGKDVQAQENADRDVKRCQAELDSDQSQFLEANNELSKLSSAKPISKKDVEKYNQRVNAINAAQTRVNAMAVELDQKTKELNDLKTKAGQSADAKAKYVNTAMDVSARAEAVVAAYDALAADADVKAGLEQYNKSLATPLKLGPSGVFQDDLKFIRDCEKDVVSGPISVERVGGVSRVDAMLNGAVSDKMIWDSGAALVTLSAATAKSLHLDPAAGAQTITLTVADGRTVKAKIATLKSVRVGGFLVKNVDCAVLPADVKGSDDLLGNTFQKHFTSRLDQQSGQLLLTPHDTSVVVGSTTQPSGPLTKAPADPPQADDTGSELIAAMHGDTKNMKDGAIVLVAKEKISTPKKYKPPVKFTVIAQTDAVNLRLAYAAKSITFNPDKKPSELAILGKITGDHHIPGAIPANEWVTIELTVLPDSFRIAVDGKERFSISGDFSDVNEALSVSTLKSTIEVKSVKAAKPAD